MQKYTLLFIAIIISIYSFGQQGQKIKTFLSAEFNATTHDRFISANPWGAGIGLQTFFNAPKKFQPVVDLTGDLYLEDDKVYRTNPDGSEIKRVESMVNFFAGAAYFPFKPFYVAVAAGPSLIGSQVLFGIKPSLGFVFSSNKRWTAKLSFIDVFKQNKTTGDDFSSISFAIGVKLF